MSIIAIDPGKTGGLYTWGEERAYPLDLDSLRDFVRTPPAATFVIEKQQGTGRRSDFNYGEHYGQLKEILHHCKVQFVTPQVWQRGLVIGLKGPERKKALYQVAKESFPKVKMNGKTCDAVLIAYWAMTNPAIDLVG